jgi:predicted SAM-dependent methyltransferase
VRHRLKSLLGILRRRGRIRRYLAAHDVRKLHLGAGENILAGWLNTDLHDYGRARELVYLDVRNRFPLPDVSFDVVFSEHMLEHLTYREGQRCLRECFRVLRRNGHIRIATPSLERLTRLYDGGELRERYVRWAVETLEPEVDAPLPGVVLNNFFRSWGHRFIYDPQTLRHALVAVGFVDVAEQPLGELEGHLAEAPEFNEYETFVLEARKP